MVLGRACAQHLSCAATPAAAPAACGVHAVQVPPGLCAASAVVEWHEHLHLCCSEQQHGRQQLLCGLAPTPWPTPAQPGWCTALGGISCAWSCAWRLLIKRAGLCKGPSAASAAAVPQRAIPLLHSHCCPNLCQAACSPATAQLLPGALASSNATAPALPTCSPTDTTPASAAFFSSSLSSLLKSM